MNKILLHLIIIIVIFTLYVIIYCIFTKDYIDKSNNTYDINDDGFTIFKKVLSNNEVDELLEKSNNNDYQYIKKYIIKNKKIKKIYHKLLDSNYQFQDYIFIIKKSSIHTCHRDGNGDFFNKNQKSPSYTIIIYLEDMEKSLGVIPESHKDINSFGINLTNPIINLSCKKGDILIFNANLLHVGTINDRDDHLRIQMKITHKDDIQAISYYENFNKILNNENTVPKPIKIFQRNLSCMFPFVSNLTQNEVQNSAKSANNGFLQKIYSYLFYGKSDFYDLPNIIV